MPTERDFTELRAAIAEGTRLAYAQEWDEARALFQTIKSAAIELRDADAEAWAEQYLGRIDRDTGVFDNAMEHYGRALDLAQALQETRLTAIILDQIGGVYAKLKDYDTACEYYQRALRTHPEAASFANGNLARLNQLIGNANEAKRLTEESDRAYEVEGPVYGPALIHIERADSSIVENDLVAAVAEAREARRQGSTIGHEEAVKASKAVIHKICGAFARDETSFPQIQSVLATQFSEAEEEFEITLWVNACVALGDRLMLIEAAQLYWVLFNHAGERHFKGVKDFLRPRFLFNKRPIQKVETHLKKMLRASSASQSPGATAAIRVALAQCLGSQGRFEAAIEQAEAAKKLFAKASCQRNSADCDMLLQELFQHQRSTLR